MSSSLNLPWRISLFIERMLSLRFSLCERRRWWHLNCACDVCVSMCMPEGQRRSLGALPCHFLSSFPGFLIEPGSRSGASTSQQSSCFSYQRNTWPCQFLTYVLRIWTQLLVLGTAFALTLWAIIPVPGWILIKYRPFLNVPSFDW